MSRRRLDRQGWDPGERSRAETEVCRPVLWVCVRAGRSNGLGPESRTLARTLGKERTPLAPGFWTAGPWNCEARSLCCPKPPSLWEFVTAAPENQHGGPVTHTEASCPPSLGGKTRRLSGQGERGPQRMRHLPRRCPDRAEEASLCYENKGHLASQGGVYLLPRMIFILSGHTRENNQTTLFLVVLIF